jgi:signal transduction histidine kinase
MPTLTILASSPILGRCRSRVASLVTTRNILVFDQRTVDQRPIQVFSGVAKRDRADVAKMARRRRMRVMSSSGEKVDSLTIEEKLAVLERRLADAQRLTALGELLGTTTHEFNNVLMTILNYAKMGTRHKDDATRDKAFDRILAAAERAAKISRTVLGVARNRAETPEPTPIAPLVDDALMLLEKELQKHKVAVERYYSSNVPPALAIGNQIQQVLLNLLVNARQAMPQGGTITVRVDHDPTANTVDVMVRDTGTGIPAEKLRQIFDPYFTTKKGPDESGRGGTGLGLSACRTIIEGHRGRIRVESTVGRGTAFTIKIPAASPPVSLAPVMA